MKQNNFMTFIKKSCQIPDLTRVLPLGLYKYCMTNTGVMSKNKNRKYNITCI
jgi:hypothetical protein